MIEETIEAHSETAKRLEEFIIQNPIAVELIEQIFYTYKFEQLMVDKFEAQLTQIQSLLSKQNLNAEHDEEDSERHPEAKTFDRLTLEEKVKLVIFNARMSQARNLDLLTSIGHPRIANQLKRGIPQTTWKFLNDKSAYEV